MNLPSSMADFVPCDRLLQRPILSTKGAFAGLCNPVLRPVYTGDFCRGNSMQFLSYLSCNSKIARVNQVRFSVRFVAAISQGFRTCLKLVAALARQKLHRVAATKIACVNGPL